MLAILATHPVTYQIPLWKALAKDGRVPFEVWFLTHHGVGSCFDREFGKTISWDIDLLSEYDSRLLPKGMSFLPDGFMGLRLNNGFGKILKEKQVKVLWVQGWQVMAYWQAVREAYGVGIPIWLRGESNDLAPISYWKKIFKKKVLGQLFKRVDKFLYIGKANKRFYQNFDVPLKKLHPVRYCVENLRFEEQAEIFLPVRNEIRKAWKIPEEAFCILFVGKFIPKKHPLDLIVAARSLLLKKLGFHLHLIFAGSGELGNQLRKCCNVAFDAENSNPVKKINSGPNLPTASFVGFLNQTQISRAYVAADCMVLPSNYGETWGMVVNEALASGLPCAVSNACGCGEDIVSPFNPLLRFEMGSPDGLVKALLELHHKNYSRLEVRAQIKGYDVIDCVNTVVKLYHENQSL